MVVILWIFRQESKHITKTKEQLSRQEQWRRRLVERRIRSAFITQKEIDDRQQKLISATSKTDLWTSNDKC